MHAAAWGLMTLSRFLDVFFVAVLFVLSSFFDSSAAWRRTQMRCVALVWAFDAFVMFSFVSAAVGLSLGHTELPTTIIGGYGCLRMQYVVSLTRFLRLGVTAL